MSRSTVHPRAGGERLRPRRSRIARFGSSPARAGNARGRSRPAPWPPVHPRAGGERGVRRATVWPSTGSSPRGRGTLASDNKAGATIRFIPARAGNASASRSRAAASAVHPRAGGERAILNGVNSPLAGSSPRGRGTLVRDLAHLAEYRFIPARAGNAHSPRPHTPHGSVHPRAGGERSAQQVLVQPRGGSSPRGRGNASSTAAGRSRPPVHPRAGGERALALTDRERDAGSSPRGRGTPAPTGRAPGTRRFIPARAGNA